MKKLGLIFIKKGDYTELHDHRQVDYCAILILEEGHGNLVFSSKDFIERNLKSFETPEDQKINEKKALLFVFHPESIIVYPSVKMKELQ